MGNRRNGKILKQVQTPLGEVTVSTPRDRNSSFDPQFIKKRETILAEGIADHIIGLYAMRNSTRVINDSYLFCKFLFFFASILFRYFIQML